MLQVAFVWLVLTQAPPSEPAVRVSGIVRTADGQQPIPGVTIELTNGRRQVRAITDDEGRYECRLEPGLISGEIVEAPREFAKPLRAFRAPIIIKPDVTEQTLLPIDLRRGRQVRGTVVDEKGKFVASAEVQAAWWAVYEPWLESGVRGPKWRTTMSDAKGEFVLDAIDPNFNLKGRIVDCEARLTAALAGRSTDGALDVPPVGDQPITLRIARGQALSLDGCVVDRSGQGLPGAVVEIWSQWKTPFGFVVQTPLVFDGTVELVADAAKDGRFPDLPLARLRSIAGRVVDRQGRPAGVMRDQRPLDVAARQPK